MANSCNQGHIWETLAFNNDPEPTDPPGYVRRPVDLQRNILNLISGPGRDAYAQGKRLNPSLFSTGNPVAYIFTPGLECIVIPGDYDDCTPTTNRAHARYSDEIQKIQDTIGGLIPNVRFELQYYRTPRSLKRLAAPADTAYFEYDPEGDGQANANPADTTPSRWRLFLGGGMVTERIQYGR